MAVANLVGGLTASRHHEKDVQRHHPDREWTGAKALVSSLPPENLTKTLFRPPHDAWVKSLHASQRPSVCQPRSL